MRGSDPEMMKKISEYIGDYYREHHSTPTTREIASAMGLSSASGYNYLVAMQSQGMLTYENGVIGGLPKIAKTPVKYFSAVTRKKRKSRWRCTSAFSVSLMA